MSKEKVTVFESSSGFVTGQQRKAHSLVVRKATIEWDDTGDVIVDLGTYIHGSRRGVKAMPLRLSLLELEGLLETIKARLPELEVAQAEAQIAREATARVNALASTDGLSDAAMDALRALVGADDNTEEEGEESEEAFVA